MSRAVTNGIEVTVEAQYMPGHSNPGTNHYVFAYTVVIANIGNRPARLETRHWVITDGRGRIEHVRGPGVVGETPHLSPGQSFKYTSGCALETPRGTMHGSYQMVFDNGERFDAEVAPFVLAVPSAASERFLN